MIVRAGPPIQAGTSFTAMDLIFRKTLFRRCIVMDVNTYRIMIRLNPWIEDIHVWQEFAMSRLPANYIPRIVSPRLEKDKVILITGPRQSGKSTLAWKILSNSDRPFIYVNCEEYLLRELCGSAALFMDEMERLAPVAQGFFFEEAQHLPEAGLFLKGLVDLKSGKQIMATGSSSFHLLAKTRESLAGRAQRHVLLSFGARELVPDSVSATIKEMKARDIFSTLMLFGGYPEVFLSMDKEEVLGRLVEAFVLRDASDLYMIRNPGAFRKLMELAASQTANLVNYSNLAENIGVSVNTTAQYLNILEESHIIRMLPPFAGGKRAEITSTPKLYFMDNGVRNYLFGGFTDPANRADSGALTENLIFTELCKRINPLTESIHFWRSSSGAEVDFVLQKQGRLIAMEVKAGAMKKPLISRSLRSFISAYNPDAAYVLNSTLNLSMTVENTAIRFVPFHLFHEQKLHEPYS